MLNHFKNFGIKGWNSLSTFCLPRTRSDFRVLLKVIESINGKHLSTTPFHPKAKALESKTCLTRPSSLSLIMAFDKNGFTIWIIRLFELSSFKPEKFPSKAHRCTLALPSAPKCLAASLRPTVKFGFLICQLYCGIARPARVITSLIIKTINLLAIILRPLL